MLILLIICFFQIAKIIEDSTERKYTPNQVQDKWDALVQKFNKHFDLLEAKQEVKPWALYSLLVPLLGSRPQNKRAHIIEAGIGGVRHKVQRQVICMLFVPLESLYLQLFQLLQGNQNVQCNDDEGGPEPPVKKTRMKAPDFYQQNIEREKARDEREKKRDEEQHKMDLEILAATKVMMENCQKRTAIAEQNAVAQREVQSSISLLTQALIQSLQGANQCPAAGIPTAHCEPQNGGANEGK